MKKSRHFYNWTGININGKKLSGIIYATNSQVAALELKEKNIFNISIQKKILWKKILISKKVSSTQITLFFYQLANLLSSGIPILQACEILKGSEKTSSFSFVLSNIQQKLKEGNRFSSCLLQYPQIFDRLSFHLIYIGEETGTLDTLLTRIAAEKEKKILLKKNILQSLLYPTILMMVTGAVTSFMLIYVIPHFANVFESFNAKLPKFTLEIIFLSDIFRKYFFTSMILLVILILSISGIYKRNFKFNFFVHKHVFQIPAVGSFIKKLFLVEFSRTLSLCLSSGISLKEALKLTLDINSNLQFNKLIKELIFNISSGNHLYESIYKLNFFPYNFIQMIKVGEETASLDIMLKKSAEFLEAEITYVLSNLGKILEPLIIMILGVLIGGLVIAMYLPIFKLGTVI